MADIELLHHHETQTRVSITIPTFTGNITVEFVYNRLTNNRQEIIFIYIQPDKCYVVRFHRERWLSHKILVDSRQYWTCPTLYAMYSADEVTVWRMIIASLKGWKS
jgi:hypothetical protein